MFKLMSHCSSDMLLVVKIVVLVLMRRFLKFDSRALSVWAGADLKSYKWAPHSEQTHR